MAATARRITVTEESKSSGGQGGAYAAIEVPGDYEVVLADVSDYDKGPGRQGWKFEYRLDGLPFTTYFSFSEAARWKLVEMMEAHLGRELEAGDVSEFDPNDYVGDVVGAHIDWQDDPDSLPEGAKNYREIKTIFALLESPVADAPEEPSLEAAEPDII
jgi:hypothetical protein